MREKEPEVSAMRRYRMAPADRIYQQNITISNEVDGVIMQMLLIWDYTTGCRRLSYQRTLKAYMTG